MEKDRSPITVLWPQFSQRKEKALLVGIQLDDADREDVIESLAELKRLAETAGASVEETLLTKRDRPTPNFFIGSGKAKEIAEICREKKIDLVVFDEELSPAQAKNLQNLLETKVIDRTELILDIFAIHAGTKEAKIQVELAQLKYMQARLAHAWTHFSRQWGAIGTRGPGETQIEIDRRRIKSRISKLSKELEKAHSHRALQRKHRERTGIRLVSVVGYTNAGKTTLFNRLTHSELPAEDKLFTTLDPKIKRFTLPCGKQILFSDTVGFIKKLPHHLVESFKATLEEVYEADLLLHVMDANSPNAGQQYDVVMDLLKELDVVSKPTITVINKIDLLTDSFRYAEHIAERLSGKTHDSVPVSAKTGEGVETLVSLIQKTLKDLL